MRRKGEHPNPTQPPKTLALTSARAHEFLMAVDHLFSQMRMDGWMSGATHQATERTQRLNNKHQQLVLF